MRAELLRSLSSPEGVFAAALASLGGCELASAAGLQCRLISLAVVPASACAAARSLYTSHRQRVFLRRELCVLQGTPREKSVAPAATAGCGGGGCDSVTFCGS